jgi:peroxiredoxin
MEIGRREVMAGPRIRFWTSFVLLLIGHRLAGAAPPDITAVLEPPAKRQLAPSFRLNDAKGKLVNLSDYRGRVVLLDFWATSCGGCKTEIPWFAEIARAHKTRDLAVVGISEDILYEDLKGPAEAWARVTPFVESHKVPYLVLMGDDGVTKAYDIKALPATYLIDRNGRIAATYVGLVNRENIEANVTSLLAETEGHAR